VLSNLALLPAVAVSFYYQLFAEAIVLIVLLFVSSVYHLCQSGFVCFYSFAALQISDHFYVYSTLVWITLYFVGVNLQIRFIFFFIIQAALLPAVIVYMHSWILAGVLIASLVIIALVILGFFVKDFPSIDLLDIFVVFLLLGGGFSLHVYAGDPGTSKYATSHSIWHVLSMLSIFFVIEAKVGNSMVSRAIDGLRNYIKGLTITKKKKTRFGKSYKYTNSLERLIKEMV
jgi:hypothetical protein